MPTHVLKVKEEFHHARLDVFLAKNLADVPSRTFVRKLIDHGYVKVNESMVKAHHKIATGDDVWVDIPDNFFEPSYASPENIAINIFYEDENIFVIHKPSGMLVHPARGRHSGTLVNALLHHTNQLSDINSNIRPGIVHRLDEDTSGLILVAKDNITHARLAKQFQQHRIHKEYVALVQGSVEFDEGVIDAPLGRDYRHPEKKSVQFSDSAKEAKTFYRVLRRYQNISLVSLFPQTGRTHQLRVHMAYLKHPILGDEKYGQKRTFARLALHAKAIGFQHPISKKYIEFSTLTPKEFLQAVHAPGIN